MPQDNEEPHERDGGEGYSHSSRNMGVHGLMRAYIGKKMFRRAWNENLNNLLKVFDTLTAMCQLTTAEKLSDTLRHANNADGERV